MLPRRSPRRGGEVLPTTPSYAIDAIEHWALPVSRALFPLNPPESVPDLVGVSKHISQVEAVGSSSLTTRRCKISHRRIVTQTPPKNICRPTRHCGAIVPQDELAIAPLDHDHAVVNPVPILKRMSGTVKTLLSRLVEKGALETQADGRRYLYRPAVAKRDYQKKEAGQLIDKLFGGRAAPLVAQLADARGLSEDDIEELEALLGRLKQ